MIEKLKRVVAPKRFQAAETAAQSFESRRKLAPKSARDAFFDMVDEVVWEDRLPFDVAMAKVKAQRPDIVAAAFSSSRRSWATPATRELLAA